MSPYHYFSSKNHYFALPSQFFRSIMETRIFVFIFMTLLIKLCDGSRGGAGDGLTTLVFALRSMEEENGYKTIMSQQSLETL
jgi:hypothetical protein